MALGSRKIRSPNRFGFHRLTNNLRRILKHFDPTLSLLWANVFRFGLG